MTDTELMQAICLAQSRFNEILFQLKNNSSDGIENLSDIKEQSESETCKKWNSLYMYESGEICSLNSYIYISLLSSNLNKSPLTETSYWLKIDVKNLTTGYYYASAHAKIANKVSFSTRFEDFVITNSYNISSLTYFGDGIFKLLFDENAGLFDTNYLVMSSSNNQTYQVGSYNYPVFNMCNVIQKTEQYILFKVPFASVNMFLNITIIPNLQ